MHIQQRDSPATGTGKAYEVNTGMGTQGIKLATKNQTTGAAYFLAYQENRTSANVAIQKVLTCSNNGMNHFLAILKGLLMGLMSLVLQAALTTTWGSIIEARSSEKGNHHISYLKRVLSSRPLPSSPAGSKAIGPLGMAADVALIHHPTISRGTMNNTLIYSLR